MLDVAGGDDDHALGAVLPLDEIVYLRRRKGLDRLRRSENGTADRLVAVGGFGEFVEDDVVRRIVRGADLLKDHMLFALELAGVEFRFRQDVGKDVYRKRHVVGEHAGVVGSRLDAGRGIDLAADILDIRGNLKGAATAGSLERHVFKQMRHPMLVVAFVSCSGFDPDAECNGFDAWKGFGCDCQAVRQTAYLNTHIDFTP